jgi:lipoyl(octanoyl) transferase
MENKVIYNDMGTVAYADAWDHQKRLLAQVQEIKRFNHDLPACEQTVNYNYLLFCEHPHVYTLGKSGTERNLLVDEQLLKQKGASFFRIDRGGDITYHGPGQIVGYPIFDLEAFSMGVRQYVTGLEQAVINTLDSYGIRAGRLDGATGVWLDADMPSKTRKICAIGVKVSRQVTMHGLAFNVNTDLHYYDLINPCGFTDKGVTSMHRELGGPVDMALVKERLKAEFERVFRFRYEAID